MLSRGRQNMCTVCVLACSQDFSKICWKVEICSVVLRPRRKSRWVSSCCGWIICTASWHTLFLGAKQGDAPVVGSFTPVSSLPFCMRGWSICQSFGALRKLDIHELAKLSSVRVCQTSRSSSNSLSNFWQVALSSDLAASSESLLMHSSTEALICAKLKHPAWKTSLSSVKWGGNVDKRKAPCWIFLFSDAAVKQPTMHYFYFLKVASVRPKWSNSHS